MDIYGPNGKTCGTVQYLKNPKPSPASKNKKTVARN
jgi:hypothetical protein